MSEKLTAEERAENIVSDWVTILVGIPRGIAVEKICEQIKFAEQAARDEGYTQGCADTIHNSPMFEDQSKMLKIETDAAFKYGLERGQREMRERAAQITDKYWEDGWGNGASADRCGQEIRALPIDSGEGKS